MEELHNKLPSQDNTEKMRFYSNGERIFYIFVISNTYSG